MGMQVRLLGALAVVHDGRTLPAIEVGSRKARVLLALPAAAGGRTVPIDQLVAAIWPQTVPRRPVENVATLVSRIRARLGEDVIVGGRAGYRLGPGVGTDLSDLAGRLPDAESRLAAEPPSPGLLTSGAGRHRYGGLCRRR